MPANVTPEKIQLITQRVIALEKEIAEEEKTPLKDNIISLARKLVLFQELLRTYQSALRLNHDV